MSASKVRARLGSGSPAQPVEIECAPGHMAWLWRDIRVPDARRAASLRPSGKSQGDGWRSLHRLRGRRGKADLPSPQD